MTHHGLFSVDINIIADSEIKLQIRDNWKEQTNSVHILNNIPPSNKIKPTDHLK